MLKKTLRYGQDSAILEIEGVPDLSTGQEVTKIGIISNWKLQLIGCPELEGKREHLESLMFNVLKYVRHQISGVNRSFGNEISPVSIGPLENGHELLLRSSQKGTKPLKIRLDDAELADLVRCLDLLRLDNRVEIEWGTAEERPLGRREFTERVHFAKKFATSIIGFSSLLLISGLWVSQPIPYEVDMTTTESSKTIMSD